ncbi:MULTISPECIES: DUF805 domain-containing protein [Asticcacaulis]|uniref:DUF805 domain-containing protein n=1 Tax=Asticcacaulis TaxID=76890 RepID=UPI001AEA6553|nr:MULTISPECIES: DUF805 domain-containing protein [Asticcacaulis]MBP2160243.1 uncharacterized membrane protein YhaH (DUF805 family) [Asticcacaulis solisilvae]MDR6801454.1 uncharacterized membrane protein YhaH (DUF805 family) [Asticcacaulis sp. BE141]
MNIIHLLFSAKGRIRRRTYWMGAIGVFITSSLIKVLGLAVFWDVQPAMMVPQMGVWQQLNPTPIALFLWTVMLLFLVPSLCISAKRWHDRNRSGWFALTGPIQLALSVAAFGYDPSGVNSTQIEKIAYLAIMSVSGVLALWVFVECGILDGTKGPNRYGPSPKGITAAPDVF